MLPDFIAFPKISRLSRDIVITEKIDGTNACVYVGEDGLVIAGSRTQWIAPSIDHHGFAAWVAEHAEELRELGPGTHHGEWWGYGIQRGYGLPKGERRFSLFNVARWEDGAVYERVRPVCCDVVPVLWRGLFNTAAVDNYIEGLRLIGSYAAPGFMRPEGVVIFHAQGNILFKKTIEKDEEWKGKALLG